MNLLLGERNDCPYCGEPLPNGAYALGELCAVLDHLDPVSRGGEDSLRNVVVCCSSCNSKKKNKLFLRWLAEIPQGLATRCRGIYEFKHQHPPEAFSLDLDGFARRVAGTPLFLELDEGEFKKEFRGMLPLANGPPAPYLVGLVQPHPGPVDIESLIMRNSKAVEGAVGFDNMMTK